MRWVLDRIEQQLQATADLHQLDVDDVPFAPIREKCEACLDEITRHLRDGIIDLDVPLRLDEADPRFEPVDRTIQLGVFPVNGNPLHWGHLATALLAMARLGLDRVVFVVQGIDRRKLVVSMQTQCDRHRMARQVIRILDPLARYSSVGFGNSEMGEDHLFTLLRLNPDQRIHAWYLVGADHYRRRDPFGEPDTLARLEHNLASHPLRSGLHRLDVAFVDRGARGGAVDTSLEVHFLPEVVPTSSTAVRLGETTYAPFAALSYIRKHGDYARAIGLDHVHEPAWQVA